MVEQLENINKKVLWDIGTAYDFFISLQILQFPAKVGLRGAWAAGVRSRLPQEDRNFLEEVIELFESPYSWIYNLPKPKDVSTVLYTLKQTPPAERLRKVFFPKEENNRIFPYLSLFDELSAKGSWNETDRENVTREIRVYEQKPKNKWKMSPKEIERFLNYVSAPAEFGEKYLKALQSYYDVFFAEEERRIAPHLENAIEEAKEIAILRGTPDWKSICHEEFNLTPPQIQSDKLEAVAMMYKTLTNELSKKYFNKKIFENAWSMKELINRLP